MTLQSRGTVQELGPWFHNLHLPDGRQTAPDHPLGDFPRFKWDELAPHLPESLAGWTALDIGCNAGFYSFQLAQRGAEVVGIDADEHYLEQARWARSLYGLDDRVELRQQTVYDLARSDESFDLILFMGVLYHLRHPLLALERIRSVCSGTLLMQTATWEVPGEESLALARFDPFGIESGPPDQPSWDPTVFWRPNAACVMAMLEHAGFEQIELVSREPSICIAVRALSPETGPGTAPDQTTAPWS
jgi:tRNA (mo5U34)-methyltransferase